MIASFYFSSKYAPRTLRYDWLTVVVFSNGIEITSDFNYFPTIFALHIQPSRKIPYTFNASLL